MRHGSNQGDSVGQVANLPVAPESRQVGNLPHEAVTPICPLLNHALFSSDTPLPVLRSGGGSTVITQTLTSHEVTAAVLVGRAPAIAFYHHLPWDLGSAAGD